MLKDASIIAKSNSCLKQCYKGVAETLISLLKVNKRYERLLKNLEMIR